MEAFDLITERYNLLKKELSQSSLKLNQTEVSIKRSYKVGKRIDGKNRALFSQVRMCTHRQSGVKKAVKSYNIQDAYISANEVCFEFKPALTLSQVLNEIKALSKFKHYNIVTCEEVFLDERYLHLVFELCEGGELYDYINEEGKLGLKEALSLLVQALDATKFMHAKNYCHRALCIENIMFLDSKRTKVKLIGFSGARELVDLPITEKYGNPLYMAPEVYSGSYNEKCDIWSLGVILFTMLMGFQPFEGNNVTELTKNINSAKYKKFSSWKKLEKPVRDFIKLMLKKENRTSASSLIENPFIGEHYRKHQDIVFKQIIESSKNPEEEESLNEKVKLANNLKLVAFKILLAKNSLPYQREIERIWEVFDTEKQGQLEKSNLESKLYKYFNEETISDQVSSVFRKLSTFKKEVVFKEEFMSIMIDISEETQLSLAFNEIDTDMDNSIDASDLANYQTQNLEDWETQLISVQGTEFLSRKEFCQLICSFAI